MKIKKYKELLKARANMHAVNKSGKSVIDYAKESQSEEMINLINLIKRIMSGLKD